MHFIIFVLKNDVHDIEIEPLSWLLGSLHLVKVELKKKGDRVGECYILLCQPHAKTDSTLRRTCRTVKTEGWNHGQVVRPVGEIALCHPPEHPGDRR